MISPLFLIIKWEKTISCSDCHLFQAKILIIFSNFIKMTHQTSKSLAEFIPKLKQPSLPSFRDPELEQSGISSLIRITEPGSATFSAGGKSQISWHGSQTPSLATSRRNEDGNGKRLKLKDYLHLNSIEKKSKKSSSTAKSELEQTASIEIRKNPLSMSNAQPPKTFLQSSVLSEPQMPVQTADPTEILRQDILKRIQLQIGELKDLAKYVKNDFQVHDSESKSQFLLFNVLNSVVNGSKNYQQIGDQIVQYDKSQNSSNSKEKQFYWNNRRKQLESPAKMLKKGLEMTFNVAQFLQGKK